MPYINSRFVDVLKMIHEKLTPHRIEWVVIGSVSLALQGVDIEPKDIDILTNKEDALKTNILLKNFVTSPVKLMRSERFESYRGTFQVNGIDIDIIGDFRVLIDNSWLSLSERLLTRKFIEVENITLSVSPLRDQLTMYNILQRKTDIRKIQTIEEKLRDGTRACTCI